MKFNSGFDLGSCFLSSSPIVFVFNFVCSICMSVFVFGIFDDFIWKFSWIMCVYMYIEAHSYNSGAFAFRLAPFSLPVYMVNYRSYCLILNYNLWISVD